MFPTEVITPLLVLYSGHTKTPVSLGTRIIRRETDRDLEAGRARMAQTDSKLHTDNISFHSQIKPEREAEGEASHNVEKIQHVTEGKT